MSLFTVSSNRVSDDPGDAGASVWEHGLLRQNARHGDGEGTAFALDGSHLDPAAVLHDHLAGDVQAGAVPPCPFEEKNRVNSLVRVSSVMPMPLSSMRTSTASGSPLTLTRT